MHINVFKYVCVCILISDTCICIYICISAILQTCKCICTHAHIFCLPQYDEEYIFTGLYRQVLAVESLDRDALHLLGNLLYHHTENAGEAEKMLKKALFVNNSHVECLCDYGTLLQNAGRNLEAEDQFLRALQVDKNSDIAMRSYAFLLHDHLQEYVLILHFERFDTCIIEYACLK